MATTAVVVAMALSGCRQDMHDQPKYEPYERSAFFPDGMASRPLPAGVVARGQLNEDILFHTGKNPDGTFAAHFPAPVDAAVLRRGQQRFDIFCSPCHGRLGDGQGMAARRGFKVPPTFHQQRLREQPPGYYFDVMTNGFGVMPSYAAAVPAADRWAIAAYVRALQLSQNVVVAELPEADRRAIEALPRVPGAASEAVPVHAPGAPPAPQQIPEGAFPEPVAPGANPPREAVPAYPAPTTTAPSTPSH